MSDSNTLYAWNFTKKLLLLRNDGLDGWCAMYGSALVSKSRVYHYQKDRRSEDSGSVTLGHRTVSTCCIFGCSWRNSWRNVLSLRSLLYLLGKLFKMYRDQLFQETWQCFECMSFNLQIWVLFNKNPPLSENRSPPYSPTSYDCAIRFSVLSPRAYII